MWPQYYNTPFVHVSFCFQGTSRTSPTRNCRLSSPYSATRPFFSSSSSSSFYVGFAFRDSNRNKTTLQSANPKNRSSFSSVVSSHRVRHKGLLQSCGDSNTESNGEEKRASSCRYEQRWSPSQTRSLRGTLWYSLPPIALC